MENAYGFLSLSFPPLSKAKSKNPFTVWSVGRRKQEREREKKNLFNHDIDTHKF